MTDWIQSGAGKRLSAWAAWMGGVLCVFTPIHREWMLDLGLFSVPFRMGPGNLVAEWMLWMSMLLLGGTAVSWGHFRLSRRAEMPAFIFAMMLVLWGVAGNAGILPPAVFYVGLVFPAVWLWMFCERSQDRSSDRHWMRERGDFNAGYFWAFVIAITACDAVLIRSLPGGFSSAVWFLAGRFFTYLTLTSGLWFLLRAHRHWVPRWVGIIGWWVVVLIPVLGIIDTTMRLLWSKGLTALCCELQISNWADAQSLLDGGDIHLTGAQLVGGFSMVFASGIAFVVAGRISRHRGWRLSPREHLVMALFSWFGLAGQQALGWWCFPRETRIWERQSCLLHISPLIPPKGCASFDVTWRNDPEDNGYDMRKNYNGIDEPGVVGSRHDSGNRPDIYLIIVETLCADGLSPNITPFLSRWQSEECQRIGVSYSASNATQLSWFSILHGLPGSLWKNRHGAPLTAPVIKAAHDAGYRVQIRNAGTFDYVDMKSGNFGDGSCLSLLEYPDTPDKDILYEMPARELDMIESVRKAEESTPPGTAFHIIALDSTHYPYKWGRGWKPPFPDYDPNPMFPVNPSANDIRRIKARYHNSLAWIDERIRDFVVNLRQLGKYDNALIIVTGDHGEEFQEHGFWFHASSLTREQTTVPILVKWPAARGRVPERTQASHLDIAPTLLECIGSPDSMWKNLPGKPLDQAATTTAVVITHACSRDSEAMHWRRDGWQASFSWSCPWKADTPRRLWLLRLEGPDGWVGCASPSAYEAELHTRFPDVFQRFFNDFRLADTP